MRTKRPDNNWPLLIALALLGIIRRPHVW